MELHQYLDTLRRHRWFVLQAVVVVAVAAGLVSSLRTPTYSSTSQVLLLPDDEQAGAGITRDPNRHAAAQIDIIKSEAVAREAAKSLRDVSPEVIRNAISVRPRSSFDVLEISGTDVDPVRARDMANAVARGYIENRRQHAVAGFQRAIDEIEIRLTQLQARIAELDGQIGEGSPGGTVTPVPPTPPNLAGPRPRENPVPAPEPGGQPTTEESVKAARYAAAVQYQSLFSRQQDLIVEKNLESGEAELVSEARTPTAPVSPQPKRDTAVGGFVGLLLGVGASFLRDQLDTRVRTRDDVSKATRLPVLAELPYEHPERESDLAVVIRPHGALSEGIRSLRTSLAWGGLTRATKVIVVTSAEPGEGKSLVAANLAAAYANADAVTCLVSGDLRRPRTASMFPDSADSPGLSGLLDQATNGKATTGEGATNGKATSEGPERVTPHAAPATRPDPFAGLVTTSVPNLLLLPPGPIPHNPAELLGSARMRAVLSELATRADVVVIDTPPLLPVTDAVILATHADVVVLVAALGETRSDALQQAKAMLERSASCMLGVVVNKAATSKSYYHEFYHDEANPPALSNGGKPGKRRRHEKALKD